MGNVRLQRHHSAKFKHQDVQKSSGNIIKRRQHSQSSKLNGKLGQEKQVQKISSASEQPKRLKLPFTKLDRVLLVGEGDFSFALSLAKYHEVASIVATSYDDEAELVHKYADVQETLKELHATNDLKNRHVQDSNDVDEEWNGFSGHDGEDDEAEVEKKSIPRRKVELLHHIDATLLSKKHRKALNRRGPFTKIVFNFPHTGGLSTDVNRQVRANQELLVGFFNAAKPMLATASKPAKPPPSTAHDELEYLDNSDVDSQEYSELRRGRILVTIFEGEPYTLWNIRDLARHCGLQVVESFKFPWHAYPGYKHARTIGDVTTGKDRVEDGKRKGAWRGEEREARCYVLGLKDESTIAAGKKEKRKRGSDSDDDNR